MNKMHTLTINGFPHGNFHGQRVKEHVYRPDWTDPQRSSYSIKLFNILSYLLPHGVDGSVSTRPLHLKNFTQRETCPILHLIIY